MKTHHYHAPLLEEHIAQAHAYIQKEAKRIAQELAAVGKPSLEESDIAPYINTIIARYNGLLGYCSHHLQSIGHLTYLREAIQQLKSQTHLPQARKIAKSISKRIHMLVYIRSLEAQIIRMYEETVAMFIETNILARKHHEIPACFTKTPPQLTPVFTVYPS